MSTAAGFDLQQLEELGPEDLLAWAWEEHGARAGIITSFQKTGCVILDMARRAAPEMRVLTVDTLRLHPETYAFMDRLEAHYGIEIERFQPDTEAVKQMVDQHGEYLFFDSKPKQELCCRVRKVDPNQRALETLDVWFTGLRWDQSRFRASLPKVSTIEQEGRPIIKAAPLIHWTEEEVEAYIRENGVPCNPLYGQGYTTIGCTICTTPAQPGEDKRAGRWRWFNQYEQGAKKECGLHIHGSGI